MGASATPRSPTGFSRRLDRRYPRKHRSPRRQTRPHRAGPISPPALPRRVSLRSRPIRRRRGYSILSSSLSPSALVPAILASTRLLQRSSKFFRGVLVELFLERRQSEKLSVVALHERGIDRLMPRDRIEESEEALLVRRGEEAHQPLRFVIERLHSIGRRISHGGERRERDQIVGRDRLRMRLRDVIARALITGPRAFRDVLRESFIQ